MLGASTLRIAWRNLGRNTKRSMLALTAIALGQFAFLGIAGLMHGYMDAFHASITGPLIGHAQVHAEGWLEPYLKQDVPKDNWGNEYVYRYPGQYNEYGYDLYSLGPDGKQGGGDDIVNWTVDE